MLFSAKKAARRRAKFLCITESPSEQDSSLPPEPEQNASCMQLGVCLELQLAFLRLFCPFVGLFMQPRWSSVDITPHLGSYIQPTWLERVARTPPMVAHGTSGSQLGNAKPASKTPTGTCTHTSTYVLLHYLQRLPSGNQHVHTLLSPHPALTQDPYLLLLQNYFFQNSGPIFRAKLEE